MIDFLKNLLEVLKQMFKFKEVAPTGIIAPGIKGVFNLNPGCHGVDISHHNRVDLATVAKEQGFIILKATEGTSFIDPNFKDRWNELEKSEVVRGAYHFFRADKNPLDQARFFWNTVGRYSSNDLPLVLDMETLDGQSINSLRKSCKIFLDELERLSGVIPMIYSGHSFLVDMAFDESFNRYPLWLARYTSIYPKAPAPWKEWIFWQYSETEKVNGVGTCDCNWFKK